MEMSGKSSIFDLIVDTSKFPARPAEPDPSSVRAPETPKHTNVDVEILSNRDLAGGGEAADNGNGAGKDNGEEDDSGEGETGSGSPLTPLLPESSPEVELPALAELLRGTQPNDKAKVLLQPAATSRRHSITPSHLKRTRFVSASQPAHLSAPVKRQSEVSANSLNFSQPHAKRLCQSSLSQRHDTFWHLDGSVVIQVEKIMFKLHRSRLSHQSEFFARLFSRAKGGGGSAETDPADDSDYPIELVDRCPIYHISETTAKDFECLLIALDDVVSYMFTPPPFSTLASILRASTALEFHHLRTWAVHSLEKLWPDDLDKVQPTTIPHAGATIILARECSVPRVLKRAYYELLRDGTFALGVDELDERDEGDISGRNTPECDSGDSDAQIAISPADLVLLLRTRQRLMSNWIVAAHSPQVFIGCSSGQPSRDGPAAVGPKPLPCISAKLPQGDASWTVLQIIDRVKPELFEEFMHDPIVGFDSLIGID
ncbi:hypothetical protein EW146_g7343 [Bondarzewia mesenterica]|uniref:BTB domain-containing protein n=1 Tax=Bondarzewia mesenterica TaxID=1095465 RepID=A0A4S4LL14_9AGAM|nr:hypothetical protein EW146_g7343 [Bondarzewia mesenterica]